MMNNSFISPLKVLSLSLCLTCLPSNAQAINSKSNTDFLLQSKTAQANQHQAFHFPIITSKQQQNNKQFQSPEVGFEIIGSSFLNGLVIPMYRYSGECPGFSKGKVKASFTSSIAPPSRNRRVIVRNVSRGIASDPFPFTDRDYSRGRSSEITEITIGPGHDNRFLIVRQGENTFEYIIKEKGAIVDQGTFTAYVETTTIVEQSNKEPRTKYVCPDNRASCKWKEMYEITVYECPSHPDVR